MAKYMAYRIVEKAFTYEYVVSRRPDLEEGIRAYLIEWNRTDLIPNYTPDSGEADL